MSDPDGIDAECGIGAEREIGAECRADIEDTLVGRAELVAVGIGLDLLPAVVSARRRTAGGRWRVACLPGVVDALGRSFPLGTAVAEARARDELVIRTSTGGREDRVVFASPDRVDALVGPTGDRTVVAETESNRATAPHATVVERFERATPATVRMPGRTELLAAARTRLDDRFADDLAVILDQLELAPEVLDRHAVVDDRTLFVALAARHDHLFIDVREWAHEVGIVEKQRFGDARRALERRGLIESVRVPLYTGRPNNRLRAVDETLIRVDPESFLPTVHALVAAGDTPPERNPDAPETRRADRPVWDRR